MRENKQLTKEVTSATIGGNYETHEYDSIGNSIIASFNGATNTYSANNLNQYASILQPSAPPREPTYDIDGNMLLRREIPPREEDDIRSNDYFLLRRLEPHRGARCLHERHNIDHSLLLGQGHLRRFARRWRRRRAALPHREWHDLHSMLRQQRQHHPLPRRKR